MLYITGIVISFFLGLILLSKKDKKQADAILAAWLFFTGIHLLLFNAFATGKSLQYPFLLGLEIPMPLAHGPFLFLYVVALTNTSPLSKKAVLHFVPLLLAFAALIPFFIRPAEVKINVYKNKGAGYEGLLSVMYGSIILSGVMYSLLSLRKLYRHQQNISDRFSFTEKINLAWLRYLVLGSSVIWLIVIFGNDEWVYAAIVLYMLFIGFFGIKQVGIFTSQPPQTHPEHEPLIIPINSGMEEHKPLQKIKYEKSGLTTDQLESIHQAMVQLILQEKLFTDPELSLAELAQKLQVHPNILSQVINTKEQRNFFDYINGHRVEAFKQMALLPQSQQFTLLSLALECGFNSKTSFNRNFKKNTGLSPSEYLRQVNVQLQ